MTLSRFKFSWAAILQTLIILAISGVFGADVRAYGEIERLKVKVESVEKAISRVHTRLDKLPLCREK